MAVGLYSGVSGLALGTGLYKNVSGLWSGASGLTAGFGGGSPFGGASLYLDFLAGAPLDPRITFSRGSNATLVDSTGKITYAPANFFTYSQEFDNAAWLKQAGGTASVPVVTANAGTAPDGTETADRVQMTLNGGTTVSDAANVSQAAAYPAGSILQSIWLRSNTGANQTVLLVIGNTQPGGGLVTVTPTWQRFAVTQSVAAAGSSNSGIRLRGTFTGNTADILVWGAQLEPVTYQTTPSTYVATTTAAYYGPRFDYDPVTLAAKGLLIEEQRTNLQTYSEDFTNAIWSSATLTIAANSTASPDGTVNADTGTRTTTGVTENMRRATTAQAISTTYTVTVYVKANTAGARLYMRNLAVDNTATTGVVHFNPADGTVSTTYGSVYVGKATMTAAGNGWYRCSITGTTGGTIASNFIDIGVTDGTSAVGGAAGNSVYIYGAQLEAGAFATSYIPTVASQVTRSADVATMTGTNFSSWFNATAGTFVADFDVIWSGNAPASMGVIGLDASASKRFAYISNGSQNVSTFDGSVALGTANNIGSAVNKVASAYDTSRYIALNGGAVATGTFAAGYSSGTSLDIGKYGASNPINGHIRSIAYYNTRLPNATLVSLTT